MAHLVTILHLSDLHARGAREPESWRRRQVFGEEPWRRNLAELLEEGPIDLVCFTGDLAHSGRADEYQEAGEFLDLTLQVLNLPRSRLSIVPGNHDIDRSVEPDAWKTVRENIHRFDDLQISRWLTGGATLFGFKDELRGKLLTRQAAFHRWLTDFGLHNLDAGGQLGFRQSLRLGQQPFEVHLIGLDSAWLCGDDNDPSRLRLTDDQVMRLATDRGVPLPGLRIALVHHPLSDLADGNACQRLLADNVHLLLRGHLHEPEPSLWADPERSLRQLAAGCIYDTHRANRYVNSCTLIRIVCDDSGLPQCYELRLRSFSRHGHWFDDGSLYRTERPGRLTIPVEPQSPSFSEPVRAQGKPPPPCRFIGRERELQQLAEAMLPGANSRSVQPVVLVGMGGVGKSTLAAEFFRQHADKFPGGCVRLTLSLSATPTSEGLLRQMADQMGLSTSGLKLEQALLRRLRQPPSLLLIENVDSDPTAEAAARLVGEFPECSVLITGRRDGLGVSRQWQQITVAPLLDADARDLLAAEFRAPAGDKEPAEHQKLLRTLGNLPLAIHLAAGHLRSGHGVSGFLHRLEHSELDVPSADPADPLRDQPERATIRKTFQLSLNVLREHMGRDAELLTQGLSLFAWLPTVFIGTDLGTFVSGLPAADFELLMVQAVQLSLVQMDQDNARWRLHPLVAQVARKKDLLPQARKRLNQWFLRRLPARSPSESELQRGNWQAVGAEQEALIEWLAGLTSAELLQAVRDGAGYAQQAGPFLTWAEHCERGLAQPELSPDDRATLLEVCCRLLFRGGQLETAESRARALRTLASERMNERDGALASAQLADILQTRGRIEEALRIRYEEVLPVLAKLGDIHQYATVMGRIAESHQRQGRFDEALRIRVEEELPTYKKLKDDLAYAMTMRGIAAIHKSRGQLREALRILQKECLPTFERLHDARARATTLSQIADLYRSLGRLKEALSIYRDEELPAFETLGDIRSRAKAMDQIANIHQDRDQLEEALRILREECLPTFTRLGDVRSRAVTLSKIAGIHQRRGQREEALRILRQECLPVYEALGDNRSRAVALRQIAGNLREIGDLDTALQILEEQVLPAFEQLQLVYPLARTRYELAQTLLLRKQPGDIDRARKLLQEAYEALGPAGFVLAEKVRALQLRQGFAAC